MITIKDPKKILIVSKSNDAVVKSICHWVLNFDLDLVKLNYDTDLLAIVSTNIDHSNFIFKINDVEYKYKEFKYIYFHHGAVQLKDCYGFNSSSFDVVDFKSSFSYYRTAYEYSLKETFQNLFHQNNTIGKNQGGVINKIKMLNFAQNSGMKIPETLITSKKNDVVNFIDIHKRIISKSMDINMVFYDKIRSKLVHGLTCDLLKEDLDEIPNEFPLSLFQNNIVKVVELRIFFIGNQNYASAIFSQNSGHTIQDYRNYDEDCPNRVVPFVLPKIFENKLEKFKKLSNLKTGSIDVIIDAKNNYYFLEVNPQGQFMGVSDYCNYNLEKKIVEYLVR